MKWEYSRQAFSAFTILLSAYFLLVGCLWLLQHYELINYYAETKCDVLPLATSIPFVAFYLLVLIAATAGYARGAIMAKALPVNTILRQELKDKKMNSATIKTKTRSSAKVYDDTPFLCALNVIISARISILPVIDKEKNKVKGVVTRHDFLNKLQEELKILQNMRNNSGDYQNKSEDLKDLYERLDGCMVKDLDPKTPTVVKSHESLYAAIVKMVNEQYTKLIVLDDDDTFSGTVDALDLIGEILEDAND